jgi:arginyl-tRNA synthetase
MEMNNLSDLFKNTFNSVYNYSGSSNEFPVLSCSPEFKEDYTFVLFPWVKKLKLSPDQIGKTLGEELIAQNKIKSYFIVKGFFNFSFDDNFWIQSNHSYFRKDLNSIVKISEAPRKYLVEYCSPNTNKPLHLGHVRNILLGWSVYNILRAIGHKVETSQIINDKGVAICKSMLAWKKYADGKTPEKEGIKPDHYVGKYYVLFDIKFKEEYDAWQKTDFGISVYNDQRKEDEREKDFYSRYKNEYFNKYSQLGKETRDMLLAWENGEPETRALWTQMNSWVYQGLWETYKKLEVDFDHTYYESQTYLLGKDIVAEGLSKNVFYKLEDGSVWIDLEDIGLDKKIILRSDGTTVYITQDLGTARERHQKHAADHYIYVVADEQDYHFKVLFETLKKLEEPYANGLFHLSYGMVDLPEGKMKSREGTVVDADELVEEVIQEAKKTALERGEIAVLKESEQEKICTKIGMAALKYFILKVTAKKRMVFNPKESVDMQGHTGPYIVNAYVRIKSILRKASCQNGKVIPENIDFEERNLIKQILYYPQILQESARSLDPSHLANYLYALAKDFHKYYHDFRILNAETSNIKEWRLMLSENISSILNHGMNCLGISMPERM